MNVKSDETKLYETYLKLATEAESKAKAKGKNKTSAENDKILINGIYKKLLSLTNYFDRADNISKKDEFTKKMVNAKAIFVQFFQVRGRNPECIDDSMYEKMICLIRFVVGYEAKLIQKLRNKKDYGDKINLEKIFESKANLNKLGNTIADKIVKSEIKKVPSKKIVPVDESIASFYITETGKKYHIKNCPYCKGRELIPTTKKTVKKRKLTACKCLSLKNVHREADKNYVTIFVDESIHPIKWNENGEKGCTGSYSYIICRGNLTSENDIENSIIITEGMDYVKEKEHVEHITEEAIGKVMIKLAYDYNFAGNVKIYTDNMTAKNNWKTRHSNSRLSALFESVIVEFVPRERNKRADKLGRENVFLLIPSATYNDLVEKVSAYDTAQEYLDREERIYRKILSRLRTRTSGRFEPLLTYDD